MARTQKNKKSDEKNYLEYVVQGKWFAYSGRIYKDNQTETEKCTITPITLSLNNFFTLKGCKLFQTDKNAWIAGPSYQNKKGDYVSYLYIDEKLNDDMDAVVAEIEKLLEG